jgi:hypothetical protein
LTNRPGGPPRTLARRFVPGGVAVAVITRAAKGTVALQLGIPPELGPIVQSWSNFILQVYVVVAPLMTALSSSDPGPLAPQDSDAIKALTLKDNSSN